jgi:predicted nucleic acid-binding protein
MRARTDVPLRYVFAACRRPGDVPPLWSSEILQEAGDALESKIGLSPEQRKRRIDAMTAAFPEAAMRPAKGLVESLNGIPDKDDRHVLAAAIAGHADVIVTSNVKDFPFEYLAQFDILCQTLDDFLIHQFHLNLSLVSKRSMGRRLRFSVNGPTY